ncbi:glycosyltransferase [Vibrio parahaemolyticus]
MLVYIDITNYVTTRAHTGIQRVLREFLYRLNNEAHDFEYKVIFNDCNDQYFNIIGIEELNEFLNNSKEYEFSRSLPKVYLSELQDGDVFFDMDGAWNNGLKRNYLYSILKLNNVKIFNFIYDLVPVILPKFSHIDTVRNFTAYLGAVYNYSDFVFFDSRSAESDFLNVKEKISNTRSISTKVAKLGSDVSVTVRNEVSENKLLQQKYILFVGTVEPRKNQKLMLDVFEKLITVHDDVSLIFIGREGWDNEELISRIKNHPLMNTKIYWPKDVTDAELVEYYQNAYINVYLSAYEGFGLPIAESLSHGSLTITSKNSSMYEVGKNFADYLDYNTSNELFDILSLYLGNESLYHSKKDFIQKNYASYGWDLTYNSVVDVFENMDKIVNVQAPEKLQFVFISIELDSLKGTIEAIDRHIDFVSEYIIVTRNDMLEGFATITSRNKITLIDEKDILGEYSEGFSKKDHQSKNWLLRASLVNLEILQEQFVMLDDDNRPVKNIPIEHFISDGKYNAYYYYDLLAWNQVDTEYDVGQKNTAKVLDKEGFELLSYSSHKPQIIDKKIFKEVVEKYFEIGLISPIDEWSVYFNYAASIYPLLFNKVKYDTLSWPGNCSNWDQIYIPNEYNFENYYPTSLQGAISEKLQAKELEVKPYLANKDLKKESKKAYQMHNMVHGVLSYELKHQALYVLNVPYFIKAKQKSWVKLALNYKALFFDKSDVYLMYYINKRQGAFTRLSIDDVFVDEVTSFGISCESLACGEYELLIDVQVDGKAVYGLDSPYMIKLIVEA